MWLSHFAEEVLKNTLQKMAIAIGVLLFSTQALSTDWKLAKSGKGISIYTKKVDGQKYSDFRGVTTVNAELRDLANLFSADYAYKEWLPDVVVSKRVSRVSETEQFIYIIQKLPVVKDRDVVVHSISTQDPVTKALTFTVKNATGMLKESDKYVRIEKLHSTFKFIPIEADQLRVEYEVSVDPGGSIPAILANKIGVNTPYKTLLNLKKISTSLDKYSDLEANNPFVNFN